MNCRNLRRGSVGAFALMAGVLLAASAAFACQTFAGAWTWTTNAGSGNTLNTVGGFNTGGVPGCDGNIAHHHIGGTPSTPLPSVNAPAGTAAVDLTVTTSNSNQCTRIDATICPITACNQVKAGSYELYKATANGQGLDGTAGGQFNACHSSQGGNTARVDSANLFVVNAAGSGSHTWNDFKTETDASDTGLYRNFCIWEDGGSSIYADSVNFLSV